MSRFLENFPLEKVGGIFLGVFWVFGSIDSQISRSSSWLVVEPTHLEKCESNWIISPGFGVKKKNI